MNTPLFARIALAAASTLLSACETHNVPYADLHPATRASVSDGTITVHAGSDMANSACFTRTTISFEGQTMVIRGYRILREQKRDFTVRVPAGVDAKALEVVWLDPDGSRIPVPLAR